MEEAHQDELFSFYKRRLHGRVADPRSVTRPAFDLKHNRNAAPLITPTVYLPFSVPINIVWYPPMIKQTRTVSGKQNHNKKPLQQQQQQTQFRCFHQSFHGINSGFELVAGLRMHKLTSQQLRLRHLWPH